MADSNVDGFLARVLSRQLQTQPSAPPEELLLAVTRSRLLLFVRKTRNLGCSCLSDPGDSLLASGFHCPHLRDSGDYWPTEVTVDIKDIRQVLVTYRTIEPVAQSDSASDALRDSERSSASPRLERASSVAARTRDCVLEFSSGASQHRQLHLEFEHNLARGVFVDAVTAAADGQVEVDYVDALELDSGGEDEDRVLSLRSSSTFDERDEATFQVRRTALRSAIAAKISLALQITGEGERLSGTGGGSALGSDSSVHLVLGSAMSMAQALDEPDVLILSWLASGFINAQRALPGKLKNEKKTKKVGALALAQLTHATKLAREHCLPLLLSLSLQCSADLLVSSTAGRVDVGEALANEASRVAGDRWRLEMAKQWLIEAALLLPKDTDAALKMQLHRKIVDVSAVLAALLDTDESSPRSSGSEGSELAQETRSSLATRALNLWSLLLDPVVGAKRVQSQHPLVWLLSPPLKRASLQFKPNVCCVHVLSPFAASSPTGTALVQQSGVQRVRVHFTPDCDVQWLHHELAKLLHQCPPPFLTRSHEYRASSGSGEGVLASDSMVTVCALFDSADGCKRGATALSRSTKLSTIVIADGHELTAELALEEEIFIETRTPGVLTVLCSQCHTRVALEDAEAHSETCC